MRFHHSISKLKTLIYLERETEGGGGEKDAGHHKSSLQTWQVWTFFILGVFIILFLVAFIQALRRRKNEKISKGLLHRSPLTPPPLTKDMDESVEGRRRSELVFFVEKEERFELEELLEGVAELRTQGFWSSLYVVRLRNGAVYAVKRLRKLRVSFEEFGATMKKIGNLRHPNLLLLVCYNNTLEEKLLVYGFQPNGSLLNLFESKFFLQVYSLERGTLVLARSLLLVQSVLKLLHFLP